jgi:hypothetical protein
MYELLRIKARWRGTWSTNFGEVSEIASKGKLYHYILHDSVYHRDMVRLIWWDLIGYLVLFTLHLHANELLGSFCNCYI